MSRFIIGLTTIVLLVQPAVAQEVKHAERYQDCMATIEKSAEIAFEKGLTWQGLGGGAAAEHCIGAALFALERYEQAAIRLEALAQKAVVETLVKSQILHQAARAWLHLEKFERADDVMSAAIKLTPNNPTLYIDRAEIAAANNRLSDAIDDLDYALTLNPVAVDALVFRASALRQTGQIDHALRDSTLALKLSPTHPEALLEHGMAQRLKGDDVAARRDWLKVLELEPDGPAAELARRNLELMDVKQETQ